MRTSIYEKSGTQRLIVSRVTLEKKTHLRDFNERNTSAATVG